MPLIENFPLRAIRLARGLTLQQVCDGVPGLETGNLSRIERGLQSATPDTASRLAHFFGHAVTELQILYPERYVSAGERAACGDTQ